MKINIFLLSVFLLIGCSNNSDVYKNTTSPLFDEIIEIPIDESANKEGPENSKQFVNKKFTHLGLDSSRGGGNLSLSENLNVLWKSNIGEVKSNLTPFVTNLVAKDEIVFVIDATGKLIASSLLDGKLLWNKEIGNRKNTNYSIPASMTINGNIIFVHIGSYELLALNIYNGKVLWKNEFRLPIVSEPTANNKGLLITFIDGSTKFLDNKNGDILWQVPLLNSNKNNLILKYPSLNDQFAVIPTSNDEFSVYDIDDGSYLWNEKVYFSPNAKDLLSYEIFSLLDDKNIYFAHQNSGIVSFDSDLELMNWEISSEVLSIPWISGDSIYFITNNGFAICLRKSDGKIRWKFKLPLNNKQSQYLGPLVASDNVYLINNDGVIYILNSKDGNLINTKTINGNFTTNPIIINDIMVLISDDGNLITLK